MRRAALCGAAVALAFGGTAFAAPQIADLRAPNIRPDETTDEGGLWSVSDKSETQAKASAELNRDPALNEYVRGVACKVTADYCGDIRVYILDRPYFNASMAPNGYMEVWSGLLLRVDNEAQLAFVLGHETAHYAHNHSIQSWRAAKARSNAAFFVSVLAAGAGAGVIGNLAYLGAAASLFSFSRENELEADESGVRRAAAAGYDGAQSTGVWRELMAETQASQFDKVRKRETRTGVFASHPINAERIEALEETIAGLPEGGAVEQERYRAMIRPHLSDWLKDELRRKDFGASLHLIERLAASGEDQGVLGFYKGEAYRLRKNEGDAALALAAYETASAQPDAPAATWRELGEAQRTAGAPDKARAAFEIYLANAPEAEDRWLVEASLKKLNEGQGS